MRRRLLLSAIPLLLAAAAALPAGAAAGARPGWWLRKIGVPTAWRLLAGRPHRVVVAVLDSGLDPHDPALAGATVPGRDFVDGGSDTSDDYGHGTSVAAVIAGRGRGSAGACPRCLVMPVRVIDASGHASPGAIAAGIAWAVDHGAAIVNLSFVMPAPDPGVAAAVAEALRRGVLLVAGAGNAGAGGPLLYPAAYPGVLSVAATDPHDRLERWSSRGGWVDVAAPGCSRPLGVGGAPSRFCGTSSATALVSGVLGLARGGAPRAAGPALLERLAATAVPIPGVAWGRVDAAGFLRAVAGERRPAAHAR